MSTTPTPRMHLAWNGAFDSDLPVSAAMVARACFAAGQQLEIELQKSEAKVSQLNAAIELGQENCDAEYDSLREERDAARADLARVTAERDEAAGLQPGGYEHFQARATNAEAKSYNAERIAKQAEQDLAVSRDRVAELVEDKKQGEHAAQIIVNALHDTKKRNAELVAALADLNGYVRAIRTDRTTECDGVTYALQTLEYAEGAAEYCDRAEVLLDAHDEARAESATPTQEPCGGRCGDPDCDLDTTGVTMRTPAKHPDTARIDWLKECSSKAEGVMLHHMAFVDCDLRAAIDAAMNGGAS